MKDTRVRIFYSCASCNNKALLQVIVQAINVSKLSKSDSNYNEREVFVFEHYLAKKLYFFKSIQINFA